MDNALQIRDAATRLFARDGFAATSLQAIADEVGVAKQTLLYHYPSKDALRQAVIEAVFEHWRERLPTILEAVTSGHGRFDALTEEMVRFFRSDADRARLLVREVLDNGDEMRAVLAQHLKPWVMLIAQYIRDGQRLSLIRQDVDPEAYIVEVIVLRVATAAIGDLLGVTMGDDLDSNRARWIAELTRMSRSALFTTEAASPGQSVETPAKAPTTGGAAPDEQPLRKADMAPAGDSDFPPG